MNPFTITALHTGLLRLRGAGPAWGNRPSGTAYVEPTCLAALALAASDPAANVDASRQAVASAAEWLGSLQQPEGALGIAAHLPKPRWTTPLAMLVWSA